MGIYADTLDELVEKTCKLTLNDWADGVATADATANTDLTDAYDRGEVVDYWNELPYAEVYIRTTTDDGAPVGQTRQISDFTATGKIIVANAFTAVITTLDTYSIHTKFKRDQVVEAVNMAIDMVAENALVWKVDETSAVTVLSQYEYSVPAGFMYINKITMADASGTFYTQEPIPPSQWHIVHGATQLIALELFPSRGKHSGHYYGELWAESNLVALAKPPHKLMDTSNTSTSADATSAAATYTLLNEIKADYNIHIAATAYHVAADTTNASTATDASSEATAITLANELKADYNAHRSQSGVHTFSDAGNTVGGSDATSAATALTLANEIKLDYNAHLLTASRALRVEGLASPDTLDDDADVCPISPAFIIYQAGAILHGSRVEQPEGTYDAHRTQMEHCQRRADVERARIVPLQLPPNSKRVRE